MTQTLVAPRTGRGRWFRLAYLPPDRDGRELLPSQGRDGDATLAVHEALLDRGYRYAGPVYNYPGKDSKPNIDHEIDPSFFTPDDLLVLTTRPPLNDREDVPRKQIPRSFTHLEDKVFDCLRKHLPHCSRTHVVVSDTHVRTSRAIARYGNILFRQNGGAGIDTVQGLETRRKKRSDSSEPDTVAYLVYEQQAWPNGPALFASFGMSGTDTLAWNFILAKQHAELICNVPFALVEVRAPIRPSRPQTLEFLRDWSVTIHQSKVSALN